MSCATLASSRAQSVDRMLSEAVSAYTKMSIYATVSPLSSKRYDPETLSQLRALVNEVRVEIAEITTMMAKSS